jgi:hypothetical protein
MNPYKSSVLLTQSQNRVPCTGDLNHQPWPAPTPRGKQGRNTELQEVLTTGIGEAE